MYVRMRQEGFDTNNEIQRLTSFRNPRYLCQCFHFHFKQGIFVIIITVLITSSQDEPSSRVEGLKAVAYENIVILLFVFYCTINMQCVYPLNYMTEAFESMGECVRHLY